jgi:hypothetical protein
VIVRRVVGTKQCCQEQSVDRDIAANCRDLAAEERDHNAEVRDHNAEVRDHRVSAQPDPEGTRWKAGRDRQLLPATGRLPTLTANSPAQTGTSRGGTCPLPSRSRLASVEPSAAPTI